MLINLKIQKVTYNRIYKIRKMNKKGKNSLKITEAIDPQQKQNWKIVKNKEINLNCF